jgi:hypothetical protein
MKFEQEIRSKGFDQKPEPKLWFYISFVDKGGAFMAAAVVQGENRVEAVFSTKGIPEGARLGTDIVIPGDKLPAEQFRNRLLTRPEVETLWPE